MQNCNKNRNFQFLHYKFANFLWFNLYKILFFDRNNSFIHVCLSELFIWEKKKFADFSLGIWSTKNINKTPYKRVAQKSYIFAQCAANHIFFTHPVISLLFQLIGLKNKSSSFLNDHIFPRKSLKFFKILSFLFYIFIEICVN